jgi:hypothetical protein
MTIHSQLPTAWRIWLYAPWLIHADKKPIGGREKINTLGGKDRRVLATIRLSLHEESKPNHHHPLSLLSYLKSLLFVFFSFFPFIPL